MGSADGGRNPAPPAKLGKDELPGHALTGQWANVDICNLRRLITQQIPRFSKRPYITDARALGVALDSRLEDELEGDFCWSLCFDPAFVRALIHEGFIPIACELGGGTGLFVLLPKLHEERCVLRFDDMHVPRRVRRRARDYTLRLDTPFAEVIAGCLAQHGGSWLHEPLTHAFAQLAHDWAGLRKSNGVVGGSIDGVADDGNRGREARPLSLGQLDSDKRVQAREVRLCCFGLWRDGVLVAGEFGAVCGCVYTSYSGFYKVAGAGSVQIALTAQLLQAAGFSWWDFGQGHAYKLAHGAQMVPRAKFIHDFRSQRHRANELSELVAQCGCHFGGDELLARRDLRPAATGESGELGGESTRRSASRSRGSSSEDSLA